MTHLSWDLGVDPTTVVRRAETEAKLALSRGGEELAGVPGPSLLPAP